MLDTVITESNDSLKCIASFVKNPFAGWIVPGHKIPFVSLFPMSSLLYLDVYSPALGIGFSLFCQRMLKVLISCFLS